MRTRARYAGGAPTATSGQKPEAVDAGGSRRSPTYASFRRTRQRNMQLHIMMCREFTPVTGTFTKYTTAVAVYTSRKPRTSADKGDP